jgi:hypothetical protein
MAFKKDMLRNPYWWIGIIGLVFQIVGFLFQSRNKIAGDVLWLLGLAVYSVGMLKVLYDASELKAKDYTLIPKNLRTRTL